MSPVREGSGDQDTLAAILSQSSHHGYFEATGQPMLDDRNTPIVQEEYVLWHGSQNLKRHQVDDQLAMKKLRKPSDRDVSTARSAVMGAGAEEHTLSQDSQEFGSEGALRKNATDRRQQRLLRFSREARKSHPRSFGHLLNQPVQTSTSNTLQYDLPVISTATTARTTPQMHQVPGQMLGDGRFHNPQREQEERYEGASDFQIPSQMVAVEQPPLAHLLTQQYTTAALHTPGNLGHLVSGPPTDGTSPSPAIAIGIANPKPSARPSSVVIIPQRDQDQQQEAAHDIEMPSSETFESEVLAARPSWSQLAQPYTIDAHQVLVDGLASAPSNGKAPLSSAVTNLTIGIPHPVRPASPFHGERTVETSDFGQTSNCASATTGLSMQQQHCVLPPIHTLLVPWADRPLLPNCNYPLLGEQTRSDMRSSWSPRLLHVPESPGYADKAEPIDDAAAPGREAEQMPERRSQPMDHVSPRLANQMAVFPAYPSQQLQEHWNLPLSLTSSTAVEPSSHQMVPTSDIADLNLSPARRGLEHVMATPMAPTPSQILNRSTAITDDMTGFRSSSVNASTPSPSQQQQEQNMKPPFQTPFASCSRMHQLTHGPRPPLDPVPEYLPFPSHGQAISNPGDALSHHLQQQSRDSGPPRMDSQSIAQYLPQVTFQYTIPGTPDSVVKQVSNTPAVFVPSTCKQQNEFVQSQIAGVQQTAVDASPSPQASPLSDEAILYPRSRRVKFAPCTHERVLSPLDPSTCEGQSQLEAVLASQRRRLHDLLYSANPHTRRPKTPAQSQHYSKIDEAKPDLNPNRMSLFHSGVTSSINNNLTTFNPAALLETDHDRTNQRPNICIDTAATHRPLQTVARNVEPMPRRAFQVIHSDYDPSAFSQLEVAAMGPPFERVDRPSNPLRKYVDSRPPLNPEISEDGGHDPDPDGDPLMVIRGDIRRLQRQMVTVTEAVQTTQTLVQEGVRHVAEGQYRRQIGSRKKGREEDDTGGTEGDDELEPHVRSPMTLEEKTASRAVRKHWHKLMKNFVPPPYDVVKNWTEASGPPTSLTGIFQPDPYTTPKSTWNKALAPLFLQSFYASDDPTFLGVKPEAVEHYFFQRIKSWQFVLKNPRTEEIKRRKRREERKRTIYRQRLGATTLSQNTARHVKMVRAFGISGMSTDESDHQTGVASTRTAEYRVVPKHWRHPQAADCLEALDSLHRNNRFRVGDKRSQLVAKPGSHPRTRRRNRHLGESGRPPVSGLAYDLYGPTSIPPGSNWPGPS